MKYDTLIRVNAKNGLAYLVNSETGLPLNNSWLTNATALVLSPDGTTIAVANRMRTASNGTAYLEIRDFETGALLNSISGATFYGILTAHGTQTVLTGLSNLDSYSGKILYSRGDYLDGAGLPWTFGPASSDGKYRIATKSPNDGQGYWLLDAMTLEPIKKLPKEMLYAKTWTGDGKHVVCVNDSTVSYWNVDTMTIESSKTFSYIALYDKRYVIVAGASEFIIGSEDGMSVNVYDLATWQLKRSLDIDQSFGARQVSAFFASDDGKFFALKNRRHIELPLLYKSLRF